MADNEFTIMNRNFKVSKIDAFKQFHIVRRLAPILGDLAPIAMKFSKMDQSELKQDQFEALSPVLNGLAKLSDKDADLILYGLLSAVEIQQAEFGNWAKISDGKTLFFTDLELPILVQAAGRAFMYNLSGFFAALPKGS